MSTIHETNCQALNILFQIWFVSNQTSAYEPFHLFFFQIIESWKPLRFWVSIPAWHRAFLLKSCISTRWQNNLLFSCVYNETAQKIGAFFSLDKQASLRPDVPPLPICGLGACIPPLACASIPVSVGSFWAWVGWGDVSAVCDCWISRVVVVVYLFPSLLVSLGYPAAKIFSGSTALFSFLRTQHTLHSMACIITRKAANRVMKVLSQLRRHVKCLSKARWMCTGETDLNSVYAQNFHWS